MAALRQVAGPGIQISHYSGVYHLRTLEARLIVFDATKDRSEIDERLELGKAASTFLWQQVSRIVDDINRDEATLAEWAKGKDRRQIIAYIESLSTCLEELKCHLAEEDPQYGWSPPLTSRASAWRTPEQSGVRKIDRAVARLWRQLPPPVCQRNYARQPFLPGLG